ncbi:hypothetical protein I4U23_007930 [Adineta vaga]|nr:hypothetical protein I4U23_007930 [Adineta vaga]
MGGRFGRNRAATDPFYSPVPPPATYNPSGGLSAYGAYTENGFDYVPTQTIGNLYRGPTVPRPTRYGGLYAQGLNQMPGVPPWNYGNYYLGNTTMQMMPFAMNSFAQYRQMQGMGALGNASFPGSGAGAMMPNMSAMFCPMRQSYSMPSMPCCMPQSYSMPMNAPMMAAATPLPIAFNPLVQGMYPMASTNPVNWMTPASFMSALTTGPMPYRPPAIDFPNNVGMVMTIPYGTPNPLLSSPAYSNNTPPYSYGAQSCVPSAPPVMPPAATYYPRPVSAPQPYPAPYPAPMPVPCVQQVPVVQPVSVVAPPIIANPQQPLPLVCADSLQSSHGAYTNGAIGQHTVLASHYDSSQQSITYNDSTRGTLPVYNSYDQSNSLIGQPILSSLSIASLNTSHNGNVTASKAKSRRRSDGTGETSSDRFRRYIPSIPRFSLTHHNIYSSTPRTDPVLPPILCGELVSDSGWLPKDSVTQMVTTTVSKKKSKRRLYATENPKPLAHGHGNRVSFLSRRRRHHSGSSVSEYDCAICQQQREKRRIKEYYGSPTLSSLLSSAKENEHHLISSNDSVPSSALYSPPTLEKENYKTHSRYSSNNKSKRKSPSSDRSTSPVLLRKSPLQDLRQNMTIHEVDEEREEEEQEEEEQEQEQFEKKMSDDNDSTLERSEYQTSQMSLASKEE